MVHNPLPSESLETEFFLESDETPVDNELQNLVPNLL